MHRAGFLIPVRQRRKVTVHLRPFFIWIEKMNNKEKHLQAAKELSKLIAEVKPDAKRIVARAIIVNLKAYLKQPK